MFSYSQATVERAMAKKTRGGEWPRSLGLATGRCGAGESATKGSGSAICLTGGAGASAGFKMGAATTCDSFWTMPTVRSTSAVGRRESDGSGADRAERSGRTERRVLRLV